MTEQTTPWFGRILWELIKAQPLRYGFALVLWTTIWTMPILVGLITARFFDLLTTGIETSQVVLLVAAVGAYAAGRSVVIFFGMRNHATMLFRTHALMRRNLLTRIYELPGAAGLDETPGEVVSRFRDDVEHIVEPFDFTADVVGATVSGLISFAIMWTIDPIITVVVSLPVLVVAVVANRTGGIVRRYRRDARDATEAITGFLGETFSATQSIKVAGAERHMLHRFSALNDMRMTMMVRDRTLTSVLDATFRNTVNIATGLILLLAAGRLGATGAAGISIGEFSLFVFLLALVTEAAYFSGRFVAQAKQATVSAQRLTDTLAGAAWDRAYAKEGLVTVNGSPGEAQDLAEPDPFQSLQIQGLSYAYPGSANGIEGIDLEIGPGEFVVVTGRIGSGKTTLLRTILGLLPATEGMIAWNDDAIDDPATFMVPPLVAYTPQVPKLFSMSLRDNLDLGIDLSDAELDESIHIATMTRDLGEMPDGLETMIGPRGVRLSGGQVQRSASARMFARNPQLLVLDDVSSALDVETEKVLWSRLFAARSGVATLVVSHRHAALARADRVIVMDAGRVVASGTAAELESTSGEFRAIWAGESDREWGSEYGSPL